MTRAKEDAVKLGEQFAAELSNALTDAGWTQADLAREMGLTTKHVNHMVNGKSGALGMYDYAAHTLGYRWTVTLEPVK